MFMKNFTTFATVLLMACATLVAQVDLESGLIAYYPFNGDAVDASGNLNDGVLTAGYSGFGGATPVLTMDRFDVADKAFYFDQGANIEIPYSTILNPGTLSISWWIFMEERTNNDYMISLKWWNCYKVNLQESDKIFFTTKVDDPVTPGEFIYNDRDDAGDGLLAGQWYHLTVSFGVAHMKFYIDGLLVKDWDDVPNSNIVDISDDPANLILGQQRPTSVLDELDPADVTEAFFKGKMDDFRFYNRILSDEEVVALYELTTVSVEDAEMSSPDILRSYPNPFSTATSLEFDQQQNGFASLCIYNAVGQKVTTLVSQDQSAGNYRYTWNADDVPTGVYFGQLSVDGKLQTKKLYLLK
jgi:hypothetical protein